MSGKMQNLTGEVITTISGKKINLKSWPEAEHRELCMKTRPEAK